MTMHAKTNICKPIQKLNLYTHIHPTSNIEPTNVTQALKNPNWRQAMSDEFNVLVRNGTWELVPPDIAFNIISYK